MTTNPLKTTTFDSALVIADMRGIIVAINERCSDLFGYPSHELVGKPLHFLMPTPYKEQHQSYIRRYLADGVAKVFVIFAHSRVWFLTLFFLFVFFGPDDWSRAQCARPKKRWNRFPVAVSGEASSTRQHCFVSWLYEEA
jgi:PAS domain-containing protein